MEHLRRLLRTTFIAQAAFEAGDLQAAERDAKELLRVPDLAESLGLPPGNGEQIFVGHTILGRCAFAGGDEDGAAQHLLASGATPGGPRLQTFGPDLELAQELLDSGHSDVVIEFLKQCLAFWRMGTHVLERWIDELESGRRPQLRNPNMGNGNPLS